MVIHEINGKVFGTSIDLIETPFTNPKEFTIKQNHYFIDGVEVDKERMELEYSESLATE